jgi:hypothetical protein
MLLLHHHHYHLLLPTLTVLIFVEVYPLGILHQLVLGLVQPSKHLQRAGTLGFDMLILMPVLWTTTSEPCPWLITYLEWNLLEQ